MNNKYMLQAIKQAKKAFENDDVPVGVVIVKDNKIISRAYNKKEKDKNAINHAEIIAIAKACKKLKRWYLNECEMYVTLEPCLMCIGAIAQARISKVIFGCYSPKFGFTNYLKDDSKICNHKINIEKGICKEEISNLLITFFKNKRKNISSL